MAELAELHGTDKRAEVHDYVRTYDRHLGTLRHRVRTVLELGVHAGASLRVWRDWMPRAEVHGLDLRKLPSVRGERLHLWRGDQCDAELLAQVVAACGGTIDLVVDDGAHTSEAQLASFAILWPHVSPGGVYVVEDTCCSYWPEYGGAYPPPPTSAITRLQQLVHDAHLRGHRAGRQLHRAPSVLLPSVAAAQAQGQLRGLDTTVEEVVFANSTVLVRKRGELPA